MKHLLALCVALVVLMSPSVKAQEEVRRFIHATFEQTEQELLAGLQDTRPEILTSVALTVRDLKQLYPERSFSAFVIPLMRIVKDENGDETSRITAAIALNELRSAMGDFAISRTAQFTGSERVKRIYSWIAHNRHAETRAGL
jgi:hypothetical protein